MKPVARVIVLLGLLSAFSLPAAKDDFTNLLQAYLQHCIEAEKINAGIVVGLVDEHGSRIISYGKLDNGTDQEVNGDTLFEIGSDGKTFTALLLQEMVRRGEMKLDDPVTKYLPSSMRMPTRNGKQITLRQLATHCSGLPGIPDNLEPERADNPYADYTVEKLYAFLANHKLTRDPGAPSEYSNLGMGLLGHVISLKAGMNYEALVVDRICRPLKMESTRITLTPELKSRFATGHNLFGEPVPGWDVPVLSGSGALRSTVNDLLKYVSANLGLIPSSLTPLMKKTHQAGLAWFVSSEQPGSKIIRHGGGTGGAQSFVGFDAVGRRGVVVLFNARRVIEVQDLGMFLLKNEWQSDHRPIEIRFTNRVPKLFKPPVPIKLSSELQDAIVGDYEFAPNASMPLFAGMKLTIWRYGDQLVGRVRGENTLQGAFDLCPGSETKYLIKVTGAQLTFVKDDSGAVTTVVHRESGVPDLVGKKLR